MDHDVWGFSAIGTLYGSLDDTTIDYAGTTYTVVFLHLDEQTDNAVELRLDSFVPRGSAFNFGGREFIADAASETSTDGGYGWSIPAGMAWIDGQQVTVSANLPPGLDTAAVDGDELVLTYFEDLDTGSEPAPGQYTVKVDGSAGPAVSDVDIAGKAATLTLASGVDHDDAVTVTYVVPTTDPLQDESGLDAAALTDQPVTNNTSPSNATGVAIDGAAQVGMTLTAVTDDIVDPEGLSGASFEYQWFRGGDSISGETASTYTVVPADVGENLKVMVTFTDDGGNPEAPEAATRRKVVPARADHCDAQTVWCATLTAGILVDEIDPGEFAIVQAGYREDRSYGSVSPATFTHRGVEYTVTQLNAGGTLDLYFATTPTLPADGAGLMLHVQRVVGEISLPLADGVFQSGQQNWFFHGAVNTLAQSGDTFDDEPLLKAPFGRDQAEGQPTEEGTEIGVRLTRSDEPATGVEIDGVAQVGMTLTARTDNIVDDDGVSGPFTYQWFRGSAPIPGQTSSTYTVTSADVGYNLKVKVTFTDGSGNVESPEAVKQKAVPAAADHCDVLTVWCATMTAGVGLEEDVPGDFFVDAAGYDTVRSFGSLSPATFSHRGVEYTVTRFASSGRKELHFNTTPILPADGAGLTLHVQQVVGERSFALSDATSFNSATGEWWFDAALWASPRDGATFSDNPLLHARSSRDHVILEPTEEGTEIGVRLTRANEPATGKPAIAGDALVGRTLTADTSGIADIDGKTRADNGDAGFEWTYRWFRVDADGTSNRTPIVGETAQTYTPTADDVDKRILVEAAFTDDAGGAEGPLASDATNAVTVPDDIAPLVVSAAVNGASLVIHFDENLAAAPNLGNGAFAVKKTPEGGTEETVALTGAPAIAGTTVTLTLGAAVESTDGDVEVSYTQPASGSDNFLRDASGNAVADFSDLTVSNNTPGPGDAAAVSTWYVYFDGPTYTASEGGAGAAVTVRLNAPWKPERNEALTVLLSTVERNGGASEADYSGVPSSVTFQPGQTAVSFTVTATDDSDDDDGESIRFGIGTGSYYDEATGTLRFGVAASGPPAGELEDLKTGQGPHTVTVHLKDNDVDNNAPKPVKVSFAADTYTAVEGGADATVAVRLSERPGRSVTIPLTQWLRNASTAHYSGVPGSVTFGPNETSKSFDVQAVDDSADSDLKSVTLGFGEAVHHDELGGGPLPAGVSVGSPARATVHLEDNDGGQPMLTLRFNAANTVQREVREGVSGSVGVTLDEAPPRDIRIPLRVQFTGGATAADITGLPATLTIEAGETRASTIVRMVDDAEVDPDEGFRVTFGELPSGVQADERYSVANFTIVDNDRYPEIGVSDASVHEPSPGQEAWLEFEVSLSLEFDDRVRVDYQTVDATARAGQDYEAARGTLTFSRRETSESVWVKVLDDDHDEGTENLTLVLSNPVNASLGDNTAEGRIHNTDRMPGAWLTRFGRAASDASIEAIGRRLKDDAQATHLTLGGGGLGRLRTLAGALRGADPDAAAPDTAAADAPFGDMNAWERMDRLSGEVAGRDPDARGDETGEAAEPGSADADPSAGGGLGPRRPEGATRSGLGDFARLLGVPDPRELLMGSSFFYSPGEGGAGPAWLGSWSAWGETSAQRFRGADGPLNVNGELATATFGFDARRDRWLAGLALSYTEGEGAYARRGAGDAGGGGELASTLASLNPYLRYELNGRTEVWGVLGVGAGDLSLTPARAEAALRTDLSHTMAAFGGRTKLAVRAGDAGSFALALRSDARFTDTASDTVTGLMGAAGATGRVRLMLEGSGSLALASGGVLEPTLEAGLRYDGGDAETGAGLEVGGGLGYGAGRLKVRLDARVLVAHEAAEYEEWGFSGSVAYTPRSDGRGLNLELGSSWGDTQSGVKALWSRETARGLARGSAMNAGQRFHADIGYGLQGRKGRALWTPYVGAQAADAGGQALRLGVKLTSGAHAQAELEIGQRADARGRAEHALSLGGSVRF